jgi:hypothetical protein
MMLAVSELTKNKYSLNYFWPNVAVEWLALLRRTPEAMLSTLDKEEFMNRENAGIVS